MAKAYHLRGTSNKLPNTRNRSRIHRNPVGTPNSGKKLTNRIPNILSNEINTYF